MAGSWPGSPPPKVKTKDHGFGVIAGSKHQLTKAQIRMLMQLCHPDKHDNSPLSQKATEFLLSYDARA